MWIKNKTNMAIIFRDIHNYNTYIAANGTLHLYDDEISPSLKMCIEMDKIELTEHDPRKLKKLTLWEIDD